VCPVEVAALPDGGFLVADEGFARLTGEEPRVRRVVPDGRIFTLAGTGRFVPNPPRRLERRGDGGPALRADLRPITDVSVMPDGGVLIAEGIDDNGDDEPVEGLIRYLAPEAPGVLATAIVRDADRFFTPGQPAAVTLASTAPAGVTLTLSVGGRVAGAITVAVAAGRTRIALPAPAKRAPYRVDLVATDGAGRVSADRVDLLPRGWLAEDLAHYAAGALLFRATDWSSASGSPLTGCRRVSAVRVDCGLNRRSGPRCQVAVSIRLGNDRRLRWGAYRCPYRSRPRLTRRVRPFRTSDRGCDPSDSSCPSLAGVLSDRRLIPWA
jgi:hypothetical protein